MITSPTQQITKETLLLHELEKGLPLSPKPFEDISHRVGLSEEEVLDFVQSKLKEGLIRRFGVVIRHRKLGYSSNAMVVWDIPDDQVTAIGRKLKDLPYVTLCYRRRRSPPQWPFNLYVMIHGLDRKTVENQIEEARAIAGNFPTKTLFSRRAFKQRGATYLAAQIQEFDRKLINELQTGIAVTRRPFLQLAEKLGSKEDVIVARIQALLDNGKLSRFGPMFNVEKFGGEFILVAMSVPKERFDEVNEIVNSFPEVAHNYEREHELNMWFVTATESPEESQRVLSEIEARTGLKTYPMPKLEEYYLNLRLDA